MKLKDVVLAVDREELSRIVEGVIVGDYRKNARTKADEAVDAILAKLAEGGLREVEEWCRLGDGKVHMYPRGSEYAVLKPLLQAKEVEGEA